MSLTGRQKRHLRGLGHHLNPVVQLGREGLTEAVARKLSVELENHELVKVRVGDGCLDTPKELADLLAAQSGSEAVQIIGHTILLYRRRAKEPTIVLPKAEAPGHDD
jgi:RNA-binding protein